MSKHFIDSYLDGGTVVVGNKEGKQLFIDARIGHQLGEHRRAVYPEYPSRSEPLSTKEELERADQFLRAAVVRFRYPNHLIAIAAALIWIEQELEEIE